MRGLELLDQWATDWQSHAWSCATLPRDLNATVMVEPGGLAVLGMSIWERRVIGLNDRIVGTDLEQAIVLHEGSHLLLAPVPFAMCSPQFSPAGPEMLAWCGAGRLSVSVEQVRYLDSGSASVAEIGDDNGLPAELIAIGQAVVHRLAQPAPTIITQREVGHALARWHIVMALSIQALSATHLAGWFGTAF